jgi:hypothetical protein
VRKTFTAVILIEDFLYFQKNALLTFLYVDIALMSLFESFCVCADEGKMFERLNSKCLSWGWILGGWDIFL